MSGLGGLLAYYLYVCAFVVVINYCEGGLNGIRK